MKNHLSPAGIDDFSRSTKAEELKQKWHEATSDLLGYIMGTKTINGKKNTRISPLFYDQLADESNIPDSPPAKIPWNAFPLRLEKWFNPGTSVQLRNHMFTVAEQLLADTQYIKAGGNKYQPVTVPFRIQDEYCEWHVVKGETPGSISKIFFTCEPPEYWNFLAENDKDLMLALYRELLHNPQIQESDIFWQQDVYQKTDDDKMQLAARKGDYNPNNKWNTTDGAIHLTHPANSLYAEMFLASDSTFGWPVTPGASGQIEIDKLMCCAGVGGINRSSDPLILAGVYNFAKDNNSVALANPIGLYIMPFQLDLLDPDGNQIGDIALNVVRSSPDKSKWLRVEVSLPKDAGYTLDQCLLSGEPLLYGGQIAKQITMAIFGVAKKIPGKVKKQVTSCPSFCCNHPQHQLFKGTFSVKSGLSCATLADGDWQAERYDIPVETSIHDLLQAKSKLHDIAFKANAEFAKNVAVEFDFEISAEESKPADVPSLLKFGKGRGVLPIDDTAPDLF